MCLYSVFICMLVSLPKNVWEKEKKYYVHWIRVTEPPVGLVLTSTPQNTHRALVTLQLPALLRGTLNLVQNFPFQMTHSVFDTEIILFACPNPTTKEAVSV